MVADSLAPADAEACRELLRVGSKSFGTAAKLLPARIRESATVLYAFCRVADDLVDLDPDASTSTIHALRERLDRAYAGRPDDSPVDRALAVVARREGVPQALLDALLEGMAWDAEGRRYETLEDLYAYAARVAGTVGAMMSIVMGRREPSVLGRACDLGVAMQLTNIARDVGEDAGRGRIYVPLTWMREVGLEPDAWLSTPLPGPATKAVVQRLLDVAADLYARADTSIPLLPSDCRIAIRAARLIYADIGRSIARSGYDSITRRAVVSKGRKLWLVARALRSPRIPDTLAAERPLFDPPRFLVAPGTEGA